ncbi:TlpA family protein disulfide reductase [Natronorubrum sulfidifaciens]|uniref:Alkyl hydroperoxide reductase/ thiol specific antioxidant/ Mal allergen n=1 Tax=Natronorubrum sulfidifaciens JCM 14089 TaxID=1230460 RepID=L9WK97_9EURY|nr:TlpA disulfide reductase family protein [Natronorubrum sulfidifaciens]ELY49616.1 alkyl hydroperoxide reductase/ thiol specific antioxidant/ Mal allergen [Natronorubrum sulfidifaciens JCM 14089]
MRRREFLAGVGSVGVVAGAGAVAVYGLPSTDSLRDGDGEGDRYDPLEIETIDAPGSDAGTIQVPDPDQPTFVDFFGTWCAPCIEQMPALAEANERIGDDVVFCSVTSENVGDGGALSEAELVEWWDDNDGNWTVGLDPTAELTARYLEGGYPSAVAIDASGRVQWADSGVKTADELVAGIEQALEADAGDE